MAIGSGGNYALSAARALLAHSDLDAAAIARASLNIAADICVYTNHSLTVEVLGGVGMTEMTPREIVHALDQHIVGQAEAKRAVAIALRNRWRRLQLAPGLREEVTPKNILMIGPTGVGKTEIARRLARLARAPFLKVEATKFTEVGYVGRDVDAMIRDLAEAAYNLLRQEEIEAQQPRAQDAAEQRLLDALLPAARGETESRADSSARQLLRKQLREGALDEREVTLDLTTPQSTPELMTPPGMEEMASQLQGSSPACSKAGDGANGSPLRRPLSASRPRRGSGS